MRLLFLTPYVPYPPRFGGSVRIYHLVRELARANEVSVLTYAETGGGGDPGGLAPFCREVICVPRDVSAKRWRQLASVFSGRSFQIAFHTDARMQRAIEDAVARLDIEAVIVEFSQMSGFRFPEGVDLILDEHNIEYDLLDRMAATGGLLRRWFNRIEVRKFRQEELRAVRAATLTLVTSERDRELLAGVVPMLKAAVVTNGVDTAHFARPEGPRRPNTAVFVGATHYFPNEDGVRFFLDEVFDRVSREIPDFRFIVVGGNPPASLRRAASDRVTVTGFVEDVRPYMWEASVFVVPLRMGGGTRFKVVEALAAQAPVVSTRLGAEGIPVTSGREVLLADDPAAFAEAVVAVLRDDGLARRLSADGLGFVKRHFDWHVVGRGLDAAIREVLDPVRSAMGKARP
jgi:polysaccharide biosynthesis protein PslH